MKRMILLMSLLAVGCGDGGHQPTFYHVCPEIEIHQDFLPMIEIARDLLIEADDPDLPADRLDLICKFEYASKAEITARGELDSTLVGLNSFKTFDNGLVRFDIMIAENETPLSTIHNVYHEILHLYYRNHDDENGIMRRQARTEQELDDQIIQDLLRRAIFDQDYQDKMILRDL